MGLSQPPGAPGASGTPGTMVLLEKGQPFVALDLASTRPDSTDRPLQTSGFNSVLVDMIPGPNAAPTSFTLLGSPLSGGPFVQEVDPAAFQSGIATIRKFMVANISLYVAVALSVPRDWRVILTPLNGASTTNVQVTGTAFTNVAQYGGIAVGPLNPIDVRPNGAVDVSDRAGRVIGVAATTIADGASATLGAVADAAVTTNAAGTVGAKLRGLVALLAAAISLTFGWLRVMSQPSTWVLNGTSTANTAQTVTQAAAGAGVRNYLTGLTVSWTGGAVGAGATVQVKDGATVIFEAYLGDAASTQGSTSFEFDGGPLQSSANAALAITAAAGGAAVITKISGKGTTGP